LEKEQFIMNHNIERGIMKKNIFLILFILLICFGFFWIHQTFQNKTTNTPEKLDINSELVQSLYQMVNPSQDATILKGLYEKEEISNDYILSIGINHYIKSNHLEHPEIIKKEEVEKSIHETLGYNINFTHQEVFMLVQNICKYAYDSELEIYELISGCGGNFYEAFRRKIISSTKNQDEIIITEKLIYIYNDWDDIISKRFIYNDYNKEKLLDYIVTSSSDSIYIKIEDYLNEASTYQYHFKKQGDHYIFKKINRID